MNYFLLNKENLKMEMKLEKLLILVPYKGQIVSKERFAVFIWTKKRTKYFSNSSKSLICENRRTFCQVIKNYTMAKKNPIPHWQHLAQYYQIIYYSVVSLPHKEATYWMKTEGSVTQKSLHKNSSFEVSNNC